MIFKKLLSSPEAVTEKVFDSVKLNKPLLLTYFNQHCFNIYHKDQEYRKKIDTKFLAYQADTGMYLAMKYLFGQKVKRIDATVMNSNILNELIRKKIPLVFIGGDFGSESLKTEAELRNINLLAYQNGYFKADETTTIIKSLAPKNALVYFIGMGVPKQELFAEQLCNSLQNKIIICVGNFLEFYFGTTKRAPVFIQKIGLEWMFRLLTEPKRLWRRYLIGIPEFIFRVIKMKFGSKVTG